MLQSEFSKKKIFVARGGSRELALMSSLAGTRIIGALNFGQLNSSESLVSGVLDAHDLLEGFVLSPQVLSVETNSWYDKSCLQAIKMLKRMPAGVRLSFEEGLGVFESAIDFWETWCDSENPDLIYFSNAPHEFLDYALFLVAKRRDIKMLIFLYLPEFERRVALSDLNFEIVDESPLRRYEISVSIPDIQGISDSVTKVLESKKRTVVSYTPPVQDFRNMGSLKRKLGGGYRLFKVVSGVAERLKFEIHKDRIVAQKKIGRLIWATSKFASLLTQSLDSRILGLELRRFIGSRRYSHDVAAKHKRYAIFFLHFEPEMAVNPMGIVMNQKNAIRSLRDSLEPDIPLFVIEHPTQFDERRSGYRVGRSANFYKSISVIPGVEIINPGNNYQEFKDNALIISTLTGSIGFEQACRQSVVVIFGAAWYGFLPNVIQFSGPSTLQAQVEALNQKQGSTSNSDGSVEESILEFLRGSAKIKFDADLKIYPGSINYKESDEEFHRVLRDVMDAPQF